MTDNPTNRPDPAQLALALMAEAAAMMQPPAEAIVKLTGDKLMIVEPGRHGPIQETAIRVSLIEAIQFDHILPPGATSADVAPDDLIPMAMVHMTSGAVYSFTGDAADLIYDLHDQIFGA